MEKTRTRLFSPSVDSPVVLSLVLNAWWKVASTPGDMVDVLIATASASVFTGVFGSRQRQPGDAARLADGAGDPEIATFELRR